MQMEHLRCNNPHRVRNEMRAHLLAYNLIRQVMCEAAVQGAVQPWQISFKGAMQTCNEFLPLLHALDSSAELCVLLFTCCLQHVVGHRCRPLRAARPQATRQAIQARDQIPPSLPTRGSTMTYAD